MQNNLFTETNDTWIVHFTCHVIPKEYKIPHSWVRKHLFEIDPMDLEKFLTIFAQATSELDKSFQCKEIVDQLKEFFGNDGCNFDNVLKLHNTQYNHLISTMGRLNEIVTPCVEKIRLIQGFLFNSSINSYMGSIADMYFEFLETMYVNDILNCDEIEEEVIYEVDHKALMDYLLTQKMNAGTLTLLDDYQMQRAKKYVMLHHLDGFYDNLGKIRTPGGHENVGQ